MPIDNIPGADNSFDTWVVPFADFVSTNAAPLGVNPADVAPLVSAVTAWVAAFPAHKTASTAASAAKTTKDKARSVIEGIVRPLIQRLQASPQVTDAQRASMQINVRATTRTRASVPASAPIVMVDTSKRLQHTIAFRDSATPGSKRKPAGVAYCEIWAKIGAPAPTDPAELTYLGHASATPQLVTFTGAQGGLTVCYWLRWVNTRGKKGPWSEPVTATIAG